MYAQKTNYDEFGTWETNGAKIDIISRSYVFKIYQPDENQDKNHWRTWLFWALKLRQHKIILDSVKEEKAYKNDKEIGCLTFKVSKASLREICDSLVTQKCLSKEEMLNYFIPQEEKLKKHIERLRS